MLKLLKIIKYENDRCCIIAFNHNNINSDIINDYKIIGLVSSRESLNNNTYIINLLTSIENNPPKKIERKLLDTIVEKARENDIKYIYMETTIPKNNGEYLFYNPYEITVNKEPLLTGLLLLPLVFMFSSEYKICDSYDLDTNFTKNNIAFNLYKCSIYDYKLTISKPFINNNVIGTLEFTINEMVVGYRECIVENIICEAEYYCLLLTAFDNMCTNNFIYKSSVNTTDENEIHFKDCRYEMYRQPYPYKFYKKYNETYVIDRTVLSYYS
jgi:hypothetical protein